jgi:hypothetical protein
MLRSTAQATALAVALCFGSAALAPLLPGLASSAKATTERDFTEENVIAATEKVVGERSHDGAFVFRDPKLNADLNLVYEKVKIVRTTRTIPRSNTPSTSGSSLTARS